MDLFICVVGFSFSIDTTSSLLSSFCVLGSVDLDIVSTVLFVIFGTLVMVAMIVFNVVKCWYQ